MFKKHKPDPHILQHEPRYVEISRAYAPPSKRDIEVEGPDCERLLSITVMGLTTIVSRCIDCGSIQTTEILGDARIQDEVRP